MYVEVVLVFLGVNFEHIFISFSSVYIVKFEQVNVTWEAVTLYGVTIPLHHY